MNTTHLYEVISPIGGEVGSVYPFRIIYRHVMSTLKDIPEDVKENEVLVLCKDVLVLYDGTLVARRSYGRED